MRIGIDVDGVILDFERLLRVYGDLYDMIELKKDGIINFDEHFLRNKYNWSTEESEKFKDKYFPILSKQASLMPGAKDVIKMLKDDGHELIIISARNKVYTDLIQDALDIFEREGLFFDDYYWEQFEKLDAVKHSNVEVMIDDSYHVCSEISENDIPVLYFKEKRMKEINNPNAIEVDNWGQIYREICRMQERDEAVCQ